MEKPIVGIVGGGLAGISAALALRDRGAYPILFERSSSLGGRAGSHTDRAGRILDVGQHVYLGCCTEYRALLARLGTTKLAPLERRTEFELVDAPTGRSAYLRSAPLPYPLSLAVGIMRYAHLTLAERVHTLRLVQKARHVYTSGTAHEVTFSEWLVHQGTTSRCIELLWEPLILATLNAKPAEVSAHSALMVIAEGLAGGAESAAVGIPRAPLSELVAPTEQALTNAGELQLKASVRSVTLHGDRAVGVSLSGGIEVACDAVIIATAHSDVGRLLSTQWEGHPYFANVSTLTTGAIVNVHLWYDTPILRAPMVGVLRSPLQWLFNLTVLAGEPPDHGCHIAVSLSGANPLMPLAHSELQSLCAAEIKRVFPAARRARLQGGAVRKMRHATFTCKPGDDARRPHNRTPIRRLYVAGDYTSTGWPSTMESAVRSGRLAALSLLDDLSKS